MNVEAQQFDLSERFPNVLLVGNGILTSLAEINNKSNKKWCESVLDLAEDMSMEKQKTRLDSIPYSLQASILAPVDDKKRQDKYKQVFQTLSVENNMLLKNIVSLGFDAILTTNYTYEIENCFYPEYSTLKNKLTYAGTIERHSIQKKTDSKYLLHTFNQFADSPPIWHIHGEERRKSSIVLTHDEYARLIHKLVEENSLNQNKYERYASEVKYKSWLDYFLMSNLYIVGLGMDFSEFDLWWILNRRKKEKAPTGEIFFFAPQSISVPIKNALEQINVEVITFEDIDKDDYIGLYKQATRYIKNKLKNQEGVLQNEETINENDCNLVSI